CDDLISTSFVGAPTTAVYNFLKCNPEGDQANCITHQTRSMEWSPDLPTKLPASLADLLPEMLLTA
uniref:Uncharacterized protein n=1 Tax=Periophthalmus magnuspinnatus TaxID=409849 RepID=A0A3B3Z9R7_9GOBI